MSDQADARTENPFFVSRLARVVGRIGLAMSGAMCGTFVAAYLSRARIDPLDSIGFIASMILIGMIAFYLGIDIPGLRAPHLRPGMKPAMPRWFYWSFAAFVFCCGLSHVLDDVTLWYPVYRLQAVVLAATAAVSLFAALLPLTIWLSREMWRHLP